MSIRAAFKELADLERDHAFSAVELDAQAGVYLAIDPELRPALFVRAESAGSHPSLRTEYLSLETGKAYRVTQADGSKTTMQFSVLACLSPAVADSDSFLAVCEAFLASTNGAGLGRDQLRTLFLSLARLFSTRPESDLTNRRQGLWGELFLMSHVRGFPFWAPFWHEETTARFDFTSPCQCLEVKTALGGERIHRFAHAQLYPASIEEIAVASLLLVEAKGGVSLRDLITRCRAELRGTPYYLKLERAVRSAQMQDLSVAGPVFSAASAAGELAWFHSADVPHFMLPEPRGVSETHYRADLRKAPPMNRAELEAWLDRWRCAQGADVGGPR